MTINFLSICQSACRLPASYFSVDGKVRLHYFFKRYTEYRCSTKTFWLASLVHMGRLKLFIHAVNSLFYILVNLFLLPVYSIIPFKGSSKLFLFSYSQRGFRKNNNSWCGTVEWWFNLIPFCAFRLWFIYELLGEESEFRWQ